MTAVLLIAGLGTRLRPLTCRIPKCLVEIRTKPLLEYWLDSLEQARFKRVYLNGFYLPERVAEFLNERRKNYSFDIHFIVEEQLTGTGGFVKKLEPELQNEEFFFFGHGDNYCNIDIAKFADAHRCSGLPLSVALFRAANPSQCGIVEELSPEGTVMKFVEKPPHPATNLASAALFMMNPAVLADIPAAPVVDFSREVLPLYQGRMHGFELDGFNIDVGTPEQYMLAQQTRWS